MSDIFVRESDKYELDIPKEQRYLNTISYDYSVQFINELIKKKKIVLEVPFQRNKIWKNDKCSSLIESIIMNVPIPPLYFAEEDDGTWLVLDGLQRLSSINEFYNNEYSLIKLEVLTELNKKKYVDLPLKSKNLLDDGMLRVNIIKNDSHRDIKYDIFMRLNRGAVTLNYQELRNCLYRGNLNDAAKELCKKNQDFLNILKQKTSHPRYLDVEFIIRYFAISDGIDTDKNGIVFLSNYRGKLVQYLNEYMDLHKNCSLDDKEEFKSRFNKTIEKVVIVFGTEKAFRDISTDNPKVYKTIADFIMPSFERMELEFVKEKADVIYERLEAFLRKDEIRDILKKRTSDTDMMNLRLRKWFEEINDVIQL